MKPLWSKMIWLLAVVFLFVLIVLKIHFTLTAKPKITVDYMAQYNEITHPASYDPAAKPKITVDYVAEYNSITLPTNYDPNDNAAPYYQKAFDAFTQMPRELRDAYKNKPEDFNAVERAKLEGWLSSNSHSCELFKIAANKPYYWLERHTDKSGYMINMAFPESEPLWYLTEAFLWNAKLEASKGRLQAAFDDIIDCYKAGCQKCRTPSDIGEQSKGMKFKKSSTDTALVILDKTYPNSSVLKSFQTALQAEFDRDTYIPDFTVEKLYLYDVLQRTFVDNGRGTGRLAWPVASPFNWGCSHIQKEMQANCFTGPTRNQIVKQIENVTAVSNQIMTKTPWQIENEGRDYFGEMTKLKIDNFFFYHLLAVPDDTLRLYHETRAQTKALIAVLAILRFKADNDRLPATFDELVSTGYLKSVPMDPYSNGPLVYKPAGDNFKLYSVGENFSDDGGSNEIDVRPFYDGPRVIVNPDRNPPDLAYWPVKKLKKLPPPPATARVKNSRQVKEIDIFGVKQDSNLPFLRKH